MKIFVTGTRGVPDIPGGVEKHCQELYPRIAALGHKVILATRTPYVKERRPEWQGVKLLHCYAPKKKSLEAIVHTFGALLAARLNNPDLVHVHAAGPGLLVPLARLLGMKVVVTNHGPDYERQKWGSKAKALLRLGEYLGGKFANEVIVISTVIAGIIRKRCGRESHLVYNGVPLPSPASATDYLESIGVRPERYILAVARFVPEKGLHDLIAAFLSLEGDCQLVIAGDADHETAYSRELKKSAEKDHRIVLTGYLTGGALQQVFSHARLFVLPSYHEGLPIALLEAMSFGLPVLVSDIPANREVGLRPEAYFRCGDLVDLQGKMKGLLRMGMDPAEKQHLRQLIAEKYDWDKISAQTLEIYEKVVNGGKPRIGEKGRALS